jgi:hypothetical protein
VTGADLDGLINQGNVEPSEGVLIAGGAGGRRLTN